jgi:hypothetical protein
MTQAMHIPNNRLTIDTLVPYADITLIRFNGTISALLFSLKKKAPRQDKNILEPYASIVQHYSHRMYNSFFMRHYVSLRL